MDKRRALRSARIIGIWLLVIISLPVGWAFYQNHLWQRLPNDTLRYLYQYRALEDRDADTSLIPGLFKGGEPKEQVQARLVGDGLEVWDISYMALPAGARSMQAFHLDAGMLNLFCGSELFVVIGYDEKEQLTSATIQQGGACL